MMTTKNWYEATCIAPEDQAQLIAHAFEACDALSVTLSDGSPNASDARFANTPTHDEQYWPHTQITALFDDESECLSAITSLKSFIENCPALSFSILEEKNWVHEGQKNFPSKVYGDDQLSIFPSWDQNFLNCMHPYFRLDPGLAFGTGTHPTTHLCLEWIATHDIHQKSVFDFGCGSGILSLAALAKGASHIAAIDHDDQAIQATKQNLDLNTHLDASKLAISKDWPLQTFDIILANVLANPLIEFSNRMIQTLNPGGTLVLSGLLSEEKESILQAYRALTLEGIEQKDEWLLMSFHNPDARQYIPIR